MGEIDLTAAVEAAEDAWGRAYRLGADQFDAPALAVRAAAPIIERVVRERYEREVWDRINQWQDDPETRLKAFAISHIDLDSARSEGDLARAALDALLPVLKAARTWADGIGEVQGFADRQADLLAAVDAQRREATDA